METAASEEHLQNADGDGANSAAACTADLKHPGKHDQAGDTKIHENQRQESEDADDQIPDEALHACEWQQQGKADDPAADDGDEEKAFHWRLPSALSRRVVR